VPSEENRNQTPLLKRVSLHTKMQLKPQYTQVNREEEEALRKEIDSLKK
jgi:hypothetical protein